MEGNFFLLIKREDLPIYFVETNYIKNMNKLYFSSASRKKKTLLKIQDGNRVKLVKRFDKDQ